MSSKLPATRPVRSDYGPTFGNAKPVRRPDHELSNHHYNQLADDVAQIASCTPKAVVRISTSGAKLHVLGVSADNVTVNRPSAGVYGVDFTDAGFTPVAATIAIHSAAAQVTHEVQFDGSSVNVFTTNLSAVSIDAEFTLVLF